MKQNKLAVSEPSHAAAATSAEFSLMLLNESEQIGIGGRGGRRKAFS